MITYKIELFEERPTRKDLLFREKNLDLWAYYQTSTPLLKFTP